MGKRKPYSGGDGAGGKRQKTAHQFHEPPTSEEVNTARQLRQLLTFAQDLRAARHGLQSFKNLLDGIVNGDDGSSEMLAIVTEFLTETKPRDSDEEVPVYLPDIMETWAMAAQMANENVMSAVAVVLALLLRVISNNVDMASFGLGICRTLVQKRQLELISKNLSVDKGRDFVLSPTLRLLKEAIALDGGALAAPIFRARNYTFKSLARNMGLRYLGEGMEDPKRPSVRTNAVRFFLGALRYLHTEAKRDLLFQKELIAALMRHLRDDPPWLIYEILDTLKSHIVVDKKLPKDVKIRLLNAHSLTRIASLYGYTQVDNGESDEESQPTVEEAAHAFLLAACTDATAGICRSQHGYYPDGVNPDELAGASTDYSMDFGLASIPWVSKFEDNVPVRNMLLAEFIQSLRPWANAKQGELLVRIFDSAPELVAHYFSNKKSFSFDPKLSATWIGYAALLYNATQLPIPAFFGHHRGYARAPPPTAVLMGNILPAPVTPKVLSRCLSHKSKLVSFYAIRILVLALQKLSQALDMFREASTSLDSLWDEAARHITDQFHQRIPDIQDVINHYRTLAEDDLLQREATSRLLLLYYEVIPQVALRAKFDVSSQLLSSIKRVQESTESSEDGVLTLLELEHLCAVTRYSPGMRWFAKVPGSQNSPFITLLRIYVEKSSGLSQSKMSSILNPVAGENQLVEVPDKQQKTGGGLEPLVSALKSLENGVESAIWDFLGNCAERCARSPIKYLQMIEEQMESASSKENDKPMTCCPLMMTIAEQIPFATKASAGKEEVKSLARFLSAYLDASRDAGLSKPFLKATRGLFVAGFGDSKSGKKIIESSLSKKSKSATKGSTGAEEEEADVDMEDREEAADGKKNIRNGDGDATTATTIMSQEDLEESLVVPIPMMKENAMHRWATKTAEELVEEGHAANLIWLLASEHPSVRKEALVNITKMASRIRDSPSYEESEQVWLLLMELAETARLHAESTSATSSPPPFPNILLSFATRALDILKNPLHPLYDKLNLFLTSSPSWLSSPPSTSAPSPNTPATLRKIPLLHPILSQGPTRDGAFYAELSWLLPYLIDGLRHPGDLQLYHSHKIFERVLAQIGCIPYLGNSSRLQILRLLYRATQIQQKTNDGDAEAEAVTTATVPSSGSDTLITRFGVMGWLDAAAAAAAGKAAADQNEGAAAGLGRQQQQQQQQQVLGAPMYRALMQRLWQTCTQERIDKWSLGGVSLLVAE